jgi:hypothetical protein
LRRDTNILYKAAEIRRIGHCIVLHEKRLAPWLLLPKRMINIFCFMISLVSLPTCLLLRGAETHTAELKPLYNSHVRVAFAIVAPTADAIFTEKKLILNIQPAAWIINLEEMLAKSIKFVARGHEKFDADKKQI